MKAAVLYEHSEILIEGMPRTNPDLPLREDPLVIVDLEDPVTRDGYVLVQVEACGVCYTDVDIIEGRVRCNLPVIPGHQVIGRVVDVKGASGVEIGDRVGVAWIYETCGSCEYCKSGFENLCVTYKATGCHANGGYAELMLANAKYVYKLDPRSDPVKLAPLMCAGAVGYRALKLVGLKPGLRLGLLGFGSSAHLILQLTKRLYPSVEVYVFTRSAHHQEQARRLGADWVGSPYEDPPRLLDRAIDFTPAGEIISRALEVLKPGGRLVTNVIRKQSPVSLSYERHLWMEREIKSVANVTRADVKEFIEIAQQVELAVNTIEYDLRDVNKAIRDVKSARVKGSAVLKIR